MAQELYEYQDRIGPGAFRLILLQPCPDLSAPLQANLITTTLHEYDNSILDHYIALSYVWGDEDDRRTAFIDGKKFEITATLDSALRHIRDSKSELKIWADGICINQTDVEERNVQVQQMGPIYQLARHTIIFLGESTPDSTALFNALTPLNSSFDIRRSSGYLSNISGLFYTELNRPHANDDTEKTISSKTGSELALSKNLQTSLENLTQQWTWFTRIWVLQELVLSLDPWVQVGCQRIRWDVFSGRLLPADFKDSQGGLKHLSVMRDARINFRPPLVLRKQMPENQVADQLFKLLQERRGLGTSDPRDMIYGHLGVLNVINPYESKLMRMVQVDYNQPMVELYKQVALYIISSTRGLEILSHVEDVPLESRRGLPSWVPDWTSQLQPFKIPLLDGMDQYGYRNERIDELCVSVDSTPALGCMGSRTGYIRALIDPGPPTVDLRALTLGIIGEPVRFTSENEIYQRCSNISNEVYGILVGQLHHWLYTQHYSLPDMLPYKEDSSSNAYVLKVLVWRWLTKEMCHCLLNSKSSLHQEGQFNYEIVSYSYGVALYLLFSMIDKDGDLRSSFYQKIALLKDNSLFFVPMYANAGDFIYRLYPSDGLYVLRRAELEKESNVKERLTEHFRTLIAEHLDFKPTSAFEHILWGDKFESNPRGFDAIRTFTIGGALRDLDDSTVEHFHFIGECSPRYRWNQDKFENHVIMWEKNRPQIVALH